MLFSRRGSTRRQCTHILYMESIDFFQVSPRMVYCSNCGQKLEEIFYFCPKCGRRTEAGAAAGVGETWETFRDAFRTAAEEMQKALEKAGEEIRKASLEVRKEVQARRTARRSVSCLSCGATNPPESKFCIKCGKTLS